MTTETAGLTRRLATETDTEFARQAHHAAYREVVVSQFGDWDEEQQDTYFRSDWAGATFEVLEWNGDPCGYTAIEHRDDDVLVRELVLLPLHQGRGVGTTVLRHAIAAARDRGVPIVLGTLHMNRAAVLYRRLGFKESGRDDTHTFFTLEPRLSESG